VHLGQEHFPPCLFALGAVFRIRKAHLIHGLCFFYSDALLSPVSRLFQSLPIYAFSFFLKVF
ncbi:MAG: hypothetical protein WBP89_05860, partial [Sedimenticolaceae bacterium]